MSDNNDLRKIAIVTACKKTDGTPTFVLTEQKVTQAQIDNGIHYYLAESDLLIGDYEEPFVHFDENEAPSFLHPAARNQLGLVPLTREPVAPTLVEVS